MVPEDSDELLFQRFRDGDQAGFVALWRRYYRPVHSFLIRKTGDRHRAEELAQETFLRAFAREETFDPSRAFKPWLYTIALNTVRAAGRKADAVLPAAGGTDDDSTPRHDPADGSPDPAELSADRETAEAVRRAIAALPEAQQEVVLLSQYQGLTYPEISQITGKPVGTVKSLMHYAVKALRGRLEPMMRRDGPDR